MNSPIGELSLQHINASELHQRVGEIIAKIRYSGERFVIERRGVPVAAVVSMQDLDSLQAANAARRAPRTAEERMAALGRAAAVRRLILAQRKGKPLPSSAEMIRQLREERTRDLTGLH